MDKLPGLLVFAVCNVYKVGRQKVVVDEGNKLPMTSNISRFSTTSICVEPNISETNVDRDGKLYRHQPLL